METPEIDGLQDGIVLSLDRTSTSSGTVDMTNGNVQVSLPILVLRPDGTSTALSLSLAGKVADRVLQGTVTSSGSTAAQASVFCREQFMNAVASTTFQLDSAGNFVAQGPSRIFIGTPTLPEARAIPGTADLVVEMVSATGEILDQYNIGQPWTGGGQSPTTVDFEIRAPLSNRIGFVALRRVAGSILATADLSAPIASFCAGTGSQFCDYRTAAPVRRVRYQPNKPAPELNQSFPTDMLPSSQRLDGSEVILTTESDYEARTPDVALDADGNAIVVWREAYTKIMAKGIAKDGRTLFGPLQVNDMPCVIGWAPGQPPPVSTYEYGTNVSARPVVAVSNTARHGSGAADRTFAVAWGGWLTLAWNSGAASTTYYLCSRLMKGDGTAVQDPVEVVPVGSGSQSATLPMETPVSIAMTESHEYVIAWHDYLSNTQRWRVTARRFGADGLPKAGNGVVVSDNNSADAVFPTVAMDAKGRATIVWRENIASGSTYGHVRIQRFDSDSSFSKLGFAWQLADTIVGIPAVAMRPASGDIIVTAASNEGDIYAGGFGFLNGAAFDGWSRIAARAKRTLKRPLIAMTGSGAYMLAWMDEAGSGSNLTNPITAMVYDKDGLPLDIDFTVSTQTPIYTDPQNTNPAFFRGATAFAFGAAGSENDYVVVWQRPFANLGTVANPNFVGGIVLQRVEGGAPPCPGEVDCRGTTIPLRITGATKDKVDIILSPGVVVDSETGVVEAKYTKEYSNLEFARKAVDLIVNGYWANNVFRKYFNEFNFYYETTRGQRRMKHNGVDCYLIDDTRDLPPSDVGATGDDLIVGYRGNTSFMDVGGVIFNSYDPNPFRCKNDQAEGLSALRQGKNAASLVIRRSAAAWTSFWITRANDYSLLMHESGHATFGLREELCEPANRAMGEDTYYHSNVFRSLEDCKNKTAHTDPKDCHEFYEAARYGQCKGYYKADGDEDAMSGGTQYGADCARRAQCLMDGLTTQQQCP